MFGRARGHLHVITTVFLTLCQLTVVMGAQFCFRERHLKRLPAFSTISRSGMFLTGSSLLTPLGLAGAALYVAGRALVKAALFLAHGVRKATTVQSSTAHTQPRVAYCRYRKTF